MDKKKRSRTSDFSLNLKKKGRLPSKDEIEKTIAKATGQEETITPTPAKKVKRIPFTTALTPMNRANLEAASNEGIGAVADIVNEAIMHYLTEVKPLQNTEMRDMFLKIYEAKQK